MRAYQRTIKRSIDLTASAFGLIVLSPLLAVIAVLVKVDSPGPIFFSQGRVGKGGKYFTLYKFRTMYVGVKDIRNPDGSTFNAEDDPRVTRLGRFLRKTSLDELPQLFNVLKGGMSLVGPRPDKVDQLRFYTEREKKELTVKPGITGLAQIQGRNAIPWSHRKELDIEYVENYSLLLDIKILLKTIPYVLLQKDIYVTPEQAKGV